MHYDHNYAPMHYDRTYAPMHYDHVLRDICTVQTVFLPLSAVLLVCVCACVVRSALCVVCVFVCAHM